MRKHSNLAIPIALSVLGLVFAPVICQALAHVLPPSFLVRSGGTFFPAFLGAYGFAYQMRFMSAVYLMAICAPAVASSFMSTQAFKLESLVHFAEKNFYKLSTALIFFSAVIYYILNTPPNMFTANARIHWVDSSFGGNEEYFYYLTQRIYKIFYNFPNLLRALTAALNVFLFLCIGTGLYKNKTAALLLALIYVVSFNFLLFADASEDLQQSLSFIWLTLLAYFHSRWVVCGILCFLTVLVRPSLAILPLAIGLTELFSSVSLQLIFDLRKLFSRIKHIVTFSAGFAVPFVGWNVYPARIGKNGILNTADPNSNVHQLANLTPMSIDGFVISKFSGAYIGHLWVFPILFILFSAAHCLKGGVADLQSRKFNRALLLFFVLGVCLMEYTPLFYFNLRYLTYCLPVLMIVAIDYIMRKYFKSDLRKFALYSILLLCNAMSVGPIFAKNFLNVRSNPYSSLYSFRRDLQQLGSSVELVYVAENAKSIKNYISYLFFKPARQVVFLDDISKAQEPSVVVGNGDYLIDPEKWALFLKTDKNICVWVKK